jgi:small-conductance mechanosensitive channel/CRP-like cAMP-binding protein
MSWKEKLRKLIGPLLVSVAFGMIFYFGGETSQTVGLEAFRQTRQVLDFLAGMGTILALAVLVNRFLRYVVLEGVVAPALGSAVPQLLVQLTAAIVFIVAFTAIAGIVFQKDLSVLLAASGVFGLVFGIAMRELILDTFTGLALNLDRPIRIGDDIQLHRAGDVTIEGRVLEISWRTTRLLDRNGNVVVITNSRLASYTITNFSMPQLYSRTTLNLTLDHAVPPERGLRILAAAALEGQEGHVQPDAPPPRALVGNITPHGVEYLVEFFPTFAARLTARSAVLSKVHHHLSRAGIQPAWPKQMHANGEVGTRLQARPDASWLATLLGAGAPFQDLGPDDLAWLARNARMRNLPAGRTLVQAGEAAGALFLVIEGILTAEGARRITAQTQLSAQLGPGAVIGVPAMLSGDAHRLTVHTRTAVLLCEIDLNALSQLLAGRPEVAQQLSLRAAEDYLRSEAEGDRSVEVDVNDLAADIHRNLRRYVGDRMSSNPDRELGAMAQESRF